MIQPKNNKQNLNLTGPNPTNVGLGSSKKIWLNDRVQADEKKYWDEYIMTHHYVLLEAWNSA